MSIQKEVISIEDLLEPIEGENPSGADLRFSKLYDEIRDVRLKLDPLYDGVWTASFKEPDWEEVIRLAAEALRGKTKDLRMCAWLAEALARSKGFAGVRDGLKLLRLMIDRFWDTFYPEIDDGDLEERANWLMWLDGKLDTIIRDIPITDSSTGPAYSYNQWQESTWYVIPANPDDPEHVQSIRDHAAKEGKITSEQWKTARDATSQAFYDKLKALATECREEFECLGNAVDAHFGSQAPALDTTWRCLENIIALLDELIQPSPPETAERV